MKKKDSDGAPKASSSPIYLFHGDEYLVKSAARELCSKLSGQHGENATLVFIDGASMDNGDLVNEVSTPSLFSPDKIICVEQTPAFVGKDNTSRLMTRICDSWRTGDRKFSFRAFGRLCASAGIDIQASGFDHSLLEEAVSSSLSDKDKQTLYEVADAFSSDSSAPKGFQDDSILLALISSPLPTGVTLVFTASSVDRKKKLYKAFEKYGKVTELTPVQEKFGAGLQKNYFKKLVDEVVAKHAKTISPDALNLMYDRSGKDIRRIHSELDKIIAFIGTRKQITSQDVEDLFLDFHEPMFFDFLTVLRTADPTKCIPALMENLKIVAHPLQTLAAITSEYRKIILARELLFTRLRKHWRPNLSYDQFTGIMKDVRSSHSTESLKSRIDPLLMKDYPLYLTLKTAQNYTMEKLIVVMEAILDAETLLKSSRIGSVSPESVLHDLVLKICLIASNRRAD